MTQKLHNCFSVYTGMKCLCDLTSQYKIINWEIRATLRSKWFVIYIEVPIFVTYSEVLD